MSSLPSDGPSLGAKKTTNTQQTRSPTRPALGNTVFVGLRSADIILQYGILKHGLGSGVLHKIGLQTLPQGLPTSTGFALIDRIGLSPYRLILLSMATGSTLKQIYWLLYTSSEEVVPSLAVGVSAYNSLFNSLNDLLFTCALTSGSLSGSETFPQTPLIVGGVLYALGMAVEITAETQRKLAKPKSGGDSTLYKGGLYGYARHANYTGYLLWRTGYGMAAGGFSWGTVTLLWNVTDFVLRGLPTITDYCSRTYGTDWQQYEKETPYKLIPYVF